MSLYGVLKDSPGYIMEYIRGGSLRSVRNRKAKKFDLTMMVRVALDIAKGNHLSLSLFELRDK